MNKAIRFAEYDDLGKILASEHTADIWKWIYDCAINTLYNSGNTLSYKEDYL